MIEKKKYKSCCIKFAGNVGIVKHFLKVSLECEGCPGERCEHYMAYYFVVVNLCQRVESFVTAAPFVEVPYLFRYELLNDCALIRPSEILV